MSKMKSKTLAALVLAAASSFAFGCTSAKPLPVPKPFQCELTESLKNDARRYIDELKDPTIADRGIFISDEDIDKSYARCLDKALREFGSDGEKWGLIKYDDGYLAIRVLH